MEPPTRAPQEPSPVNPNPSANPLAAKKTSSFQMPRASKVAAIAVWAHPVHFFS